MFDANNLILVLDTRIADFLRNRAPVQIEESEEQELLKKLVVIFRVRVWPTARKFPGVSQGWPTNLIC